MFIYLRELEERTLVGVLAISQSTIPDQQPGVVSCQVHLYLALKNSSLKMKFDPQKQQIFTEHLTFDAPKYHGINFHMMGKYHRAAVDGYVDMLCDASKRDTNLPVEDSMLTPTLLAAQHGHLEALRILVGRGGDPERTDREGLSALHLAASRNHLSCVSFLVNFGVNMWALDNDLHTAKDLAAIGEHKTVS